MANEIRVRANLVSGTLNGALTNVATSMSAAGLANLPVVDATSHALIVIENEIVYVTAHTGGATTATILRGQEGTTAAAHNNGVAWQHGSAVSDFGEWISYTPTLTQSATVTKTVTYAKYQRASRMITVIVDLAVTGAGTGANDVFVGLPVTASASGPYVGVGSIFDTSANLRYKGLAQLASTTLIALSTVHSTAPGNLGSSDFTAALAAGDNVRMSCTYEAATF